MSFQDLLTSGHRKLGALALIFLFRTILTVSWRHRGKGIIGVLCYPAQLISYYLFPIAASSFWSWRPRVMLAAYAWFRLVDDVMDDDSPPPLSMTREQYLHRKNQILESLTTSTVVSAPSQPEDVLLAFVLAMANQKEIDVAQDLVDLWKVMTWDDQRYRQARLASREELVRYAELQDRSVLSFCVKVGGGDSQRFDNLASHIVGLFTRTDWLLDIEKDLRKGVVNIAVEAVEKYGLDLAQLGSNETDGALWSDPGFIAWYSDEVTALEAQWVDLRGALNGRFGEVFRSRMLTYLFQRLVVGHFEQEFRTVMSRR